ncbi:AbrB/MazE/SpoVT family DNA-binding domain-containing protein [Clostridium sp. 19966]|uniref:AbrB/MazE/SpoVT family DNA-binding domain-containing protein n=1 Tax=Clostridium sp. 19966 TaxID=2768166 RepID=UPI0028DEE09E|nr:AbrB/MazE/SpoVT family DNA-binding domain-containing protein [Clostridium sp. 19966]MDT8719504.1 AbrB/MazE/SpoVT family DNA-binding domain-containing protein [Clostridium sp. 19966]
MRSIGIVRNVDELGRVVIPKETRDKLMIKIGDSLEIFYDETSIYLRKYAPGCTFCNNVNNIRKFRGIYICDECYDELVNKEFAEK